MIAEQLSIISPPLCFTVTGIRGKSNMEFVLNWWVR